MADESRTRTELIVASGEEIAEMRTQMADLRQFVRYQTERLQADNDLVRAELKAVQVMVGELMAVLAQS